MGNVTNHPTIPATPPATRSAGHEGLSVSEGMFNMVELPRTDEDAGVRKREVASYLTGKIQLGHGRMLKV